VGIGWAGAHQQTLGHLQQQRQDHLESNHTARLSGCQWLRAQGDSRVERQRHRHPCHPPP
jgi:hypothetical protein